MCHDACAGKNDPIQQILESDQKTALTYPETIVSLKNTGNLTRLFLGLTIGGKCSISCFSIFQYCYSVINIDKFCIIALKKFKNY
uniref:Uncharacterized protein n=1 Tax=Elaeophora elaphi TaxID=1147741 RepID=A0A0R3RK42_9BILA